MLAMMFVGFSICIAGAIGVCRRIVVSSECDTFGKLWTKAILSEYDVHLFEDYYLWIRMLKNGCHGHNLKEPVLYMRTPADIYRRRGGVQYARDMIRFHRWLRKTGWSSLKDYMTGAIPHFVVCILPSGMRRIVYRVLHK